MAASFVLLRSVKLAILIQLYGTVKMRILGVDCFLQDMTLSLTHDFVFFQLSPIRFQNC